MPTLNRIRLNHILYNNNHNLIKDMIFEVDGLTTLVNLENGGGKTVINQLCHAPYIFGRDRNFGKRKFEELFATNTPSFVLHEWNMDDDAGRFIVGLMICRRRVQSTNAPSAMQSPVNKLGITAFIEEFAGSGPSMISDYVLGHERQTYTLSEASKYLDSLAAKKNRSFRTYNLDNTSQRAAYISRLGELGVSLSEWKQMRNFNQEESGIAKFSELYPTDERLLNDVLIPAVEARLDSYGKAAGQSETIMEQIASGVIKYARNLKEHQEDLESFDTFEAYQHFLETVEDKAGQVRKAFENRTASENTMQAWHFGLQKRMERQKERLEELGQLEQETAKEAVKLKADELSYHWHERNEEQLNIQTSLEANEEALQQCEQDIAQTQKELNLQDCAERYQNLHESKLKLHTRQTERDATKLDSDEAQRQMARFGAGLYGCYEQESLQQDGILAEIETRLEQEEAKLTDCRTKEKEAQAALQDYAKEQSACQVRLDTYDAKEAKAEKQLNLTITHQMEPYTHDAFFAAQKQKAQTSLEKAGKKKLTLQKQQTKLKASLQELSGERIRLSASMGSLESEIASQQKNWKLLEEQRKKRMDLAMELFGQQADAAEEDQSWTPDSVQEAKLLLWNDEKLEQALQTRLLADEGIIEGLQEEILETAQSISNLQTGTSARIDPEVQNIADAQGIELVFVSSWLREGSIRKETALSYIEKFPILPYALIMSASQKNSLLKALKERGIYTSQILPILEREKLEQLDQLEADAASLESYLYASFNSDLLDQSILAQKIAALQKQKQEKAERKKQYESDVRQIVQTKTWLAQSIGLSDYVKAFRTMMQAQNQMTDLKNERQELIIRQEKTQAELAQSEQETKENEVLIAELKTRIALLGELHQEVQAARTQYTTLQKLSVLISQSRQLLEQVQEQIQSLGKAIREDEIERTAQLSRSREITKQLDLYQPYANDPDPEEGDPDYLLSQFEMWKDDPSRQNLRQIEREIKELSAQIRSASQALQEQAEDMQLSMEEIAKTPFNAQTRRTARQNLPKLQAQSRKLSSLISGLQVDQARLEEQKHALERELLEQSGLTEILPKESIAVVDWKEEIRQKNELLTLCRKEADTLEKDGSRLEAQDARLQDTLSGINFSKRTVFAQDLTDYSITEITTRLSNMNQQLLAAKEEQRTLGSALKNLLQEKGRHIESTYPNLQSLNASLADTAEDPEAFAPVFDHSRQIIAQYLASIQASRDEILKLKEQSVRHIFDHLVQIREQLGRIDSSMSITIDETRMKMLEIRLPEFDKNEESSQAKLDAYVEESARQMIDADMEPTIVWKRITAQNLLALLIPASAVRIRIRKIEEYRSDLVAWHTVAKLSGAESFLSSMIIMLAVLYYQRAEPLMQLSAKTRPTAIFMDNPFAYVQSEHILAPLLELLKKTGTQMIALSKVENAAIIKAFPNIYFLHLKLFADQKQHLIAEHEKGQTYMDSLHMEMIPDEGALADGQMDEEQDQDSEEDSLVDPLGYFGA